MVGCTVDTPDEELEVLSHLSLSIVGDLLPTLPTCKRTNNCWLGSVVADKCGQQIRSARRRSNETLQDLLRLDSQG